MDKLFREGFISPRAHRLFHIPVPLPSRFAVSLPGGENRNWIRVSEDANEPYEAFKVGSLDNLVTAFGLAVQKDSVPLSIGIG